MNKKFLGIIVGIGVVIAVIAVAMSISNHDILSTPQTNQKIGLVINSPNQSTTLQELNDVYSEAADSGIGRSNVYLFWNLVEPVRGEYDWEQSDVLMSFNKTQSYFVFFYN
jgi:GH35 family endo-1,4-beta-xylanase